MQFIIFIYIYKEFRLILLSGLKIENAFKMLKWVCRTSVVFWLESLVFWHWRILENEAIWDIYRFFLHSREMTLAYFYEIKLDVRSGEQRVGNSPRLRLRSRIIDKNSLFTLKKNKGIQSVLFSSVKRPIPMCSPSIPWQYECVRAINWLWCKFEGHQTLLWPIPVLTTKNFFLSWRKCLFQTITILFFSEILN
jgi:hypothetical protein